MNIKQLIPLVALFFIAACTPKTTETTQTVPVEEVVVKETPKPDENLSPCKNWLSLPKDQQDKVKITHSLYRDVMKNIRGANELARVSEEDLKRTFDNWKVVFDVAPAADGKRNTHYGDGIKLHEYMASQEKDSLKRDGHIKKILFLYDEVIKCYGREGFTTGRKAFDLYYKYPEYATDIEKFNMFKKAIDIEKEDTPAFLINPFTALLSNLIVDEKISIDEASPYADKVLDLLKTNKEKLSAAKWTGEGWDVVESYAPARLKTLEGMKGFYDCDYYKEQYYASFENAPADCDSIIRVLSRMKWADCAGEDPQVNKVFTAYKTNCIAVDPGCRGFISEGDYAGAVDCYTQKAEESTNAEDKAKYYLFIAKIYYGELKKYSQARKFAREALKHKPNWGEPYLLIGKLYASSGPLCGPGRGWDSQVVTWPAIDKWQQAKRVDPSVAAEANKLIRRYEKFMPTVEDIFQRGMKEGQKFTVRCWIQETTTIRAAK